MSKSLFGIEQNKYYIPDFLIELQILQVFATEFVTFVIESVLFALEFIAFAVEFGAFAVEFVGFAIEFVALAIEFSAFAIELRRRFSPRRFCIRIRL